jgi:hypothetical protein
MNEMPTDWRIETPSITLYAFHLRNDITKGSQQVMDNADRLWEQCIAFGEKRDIVILKSLKQELRSYAYNSIDRQYRYTPANEDIEATAAEKPYLNDWLELVKKNSKSSKARHLRFHVETRHLPSLQNVLLLGEIYPLRIHDTYAVDLTLRYRNLIDIPHLHLLNPSDTIEPSLGQTLLLFTKPVNVPESAYQDFADRCVAALLGENPQRQNFPSQIQLTARGQLFGSPIFEYDNHKENPSERRHVLVWVDTHPETLQRKERGEADRTLLNLLCCRSKILYSYHRSRLCDRAARKVYSELEGQINTLATPSRETLETLKQWLKQTPLRVLKYDKLLHDIEGYQNAIAINTQNYRSYLDKFKSLCVENDNLQFLENFLNFTSKQFQSQIKADLRYLTPAQGLFQQTIDTIRGIVEIEAEEQAQVREREEKERDRQLQTTIAVVGAGIGFAGLAAACSPYLIPPDPQTPKIPLKLPFASGSLHPLVASILLSLVCGFAGLGIAKVVTMLIQHGSNKRANLEGSANNKPVHRANTGLVRQARMPKQVEFLTFSQENSNSKKVKDRRTLR